MKKWLVVLMSFLIFGFPAMAQPEEPSEEMPAEVLTLKKNEIPPAVIKAAQDLFKGSTQIKWGIFPYEFKNYGWIKVKSESDAPPSGKVDTYEIFLKTSKGNDAYAVFEGDGDLVRCRIMDKDIALPESIQKAIAKSEYNGWKIRDDKEKVSGAKGKVVEHYIVRLEKGTQKKTLYFTLNGDLLINK